MNPLAKITSLFKTKNIERKAKKALSKEAINKLVESRIKELKKLEEHKVFAENALATMLFIKEGTTTIDEETITNSFNVIQSHLKDFEENGQTVAIAKAQWCMSLLEREKKLIKLGFNKAIHMTKLYEFIQTHRTRTIFVEGLETFDRPIPKDVTEKIKQVKDIFDDIVIVYSNNSDLKNKKIARDKDPIVLGIFKAELDVGVAFANISSDLGYVIGDWEDEFCDLTLDRAIKEAAKQNVNLTLEPIGDSVTIHDHISYDGSNQRSASNK